MCAAAQNISNIYMSGKARGNVSLYKDSKLIKKDSFMLAKVPKFGFGNSSTKQSQILLTGTLL